MGDVIQLDEVRNAKKVETAENREAASAKIITESLRDAVLDALSRGLKVCNIKVSWSEADNGDEEYSLEIIAKRMTK